jgi:simple sugar transport system ATP-binding protein
MAELIRMEHIDKSYGSVKALEDVTFVVNEREIVGLLGDNGAGKSTLIKVLSGAVPITSGDIFVRGSKVTIRTATDAISHGIETIYQDSALVTQLSISRNLFLGREPIKGARFFNRMDKAKMEAVASSSWRVGIGARKIPPNTPIAVGASGRRSPSHAMYFDSDVIILDEPTNNLGVAETQGVLNWCAARPGHSRTSIAQHPPVFQVVDRIVVMRRGRIVADDIDPKQTSVEEVERVITGMSDITPRVAHA